MAIADPVVVGGIGVRSGLRDQEQARALGAAAMPPDLVSFMVSLAAPYLWFPLPGWSWTTLPDCGSFWPARAAWRCIIWDAPFRAGMSSLTMTQLRLVPVLLEMVPVLPRARQLSLWGEAVEQRSPDLIGV